MEDASLQDGIEILLLLHNINSNSYYFPSKNAGRPYIDRVWLKTPLKNFKVKLPYVFT